MHIVTPTEIEQVAWGGQLEPLGEVYRPKSAASYRVTLGEPVSRGGCRHHKRLYQGLISRHPGRAGELARRGGDAVRDG